MADPFVCTVCGRDRQRRSHFLWIATLVSVFYGQFIPPNGPVCVECAPTVSTIGGRVFWGLIIVGTLFLLFHGIPHRAIE